MVLRQSWSGAGWSGLSGRSGGLLTGCSTTSLETFLLADGSARRTLLSDCGAPVEGNRGMSQLRQRK